MPGNLGRITEACRHSELRDFEVARKIGGRQRSTVQVALCSVAMFAPQPRRLSARLHAFSEDLKAQAPGP
jgi:hypothetical protein